MYVYTPTKALLKFRGGSIPASQTFHENSIDRAICTTNVGPNTNKEIRAYNFVQKDILKPLITEAVEVVTTQWNL